MRIIQAMTMVICSCLVATSDEPTHSAVQLELKSKEKPTSYWMQQKLNYSQAILRGLATGELEEVAMNAEQMRLLSTVEGFFRRKEPGYKGQLQSFDFASTEIVRHARAGNLEAAAMGYQQLAISCVSCHVMLREPKSDAAAPKIKQPSK